MATIKEIKAEICIEKPGESKPKKISAEITIEIIPDEDEIKELVKAQKKTERRSVVFFLALIICVVSILYMIFIKFTACAFWVAFASACTAFQTGLNAGVEIMSNEGRRNDRFIANPPNPV